MYIRCSNCERCWRLESADRTDSIRCNYCGRKFPLADPGTLGATPADRFRRALEHAQTHGVDLASAYSVLLGILPADRVSRIDAADPTVKGSSKKHPKFPEGFDPGFRFAVRERFLTPREAAERGDRVRYASAIAQKHGLAMHLAFLVTENRLPLDAALARAGKGATPARPAPETAPTDPSSRKPVVLLVASIASIFGLVWLLDASSTPPGNVPVPAAARIAPTKPVAPTLGTAFEIRTDPKGRVTAVRGAKDPRSALEALCGEDPGESRRIALRVERADGSWTGVFKEGREIRTVPIRQDPATETWQAEIEPGPTEPVSR